MRLVHDRNRFNPVKDQCFIGLCNTQYSYEPGLYSRNWLFLVKNYFGYFYYFFSEFQMIPRGSESSDSSYDDGSRVPLTKKSMLEQRTDSETRIYTSLERYGTFVILFVVSLLCQVDDR